jgi:hypothetical protein
MTLNRRTGSGSDLADTLDSTTNLQTGAINSGILEAMEQRGVE